jgi:hypothetical protein
MAHVRIRADGKKNRTGPLDGKSATTVAIIRLFYLVRNRLEELGTKLKPQPQTEPNREISLKLL